MTLASIPLAEEQLTVGVATPITAATFAGTDGQPLDITEAVFTLVSGGNIYHSSLQGATPSNTGANGENFEKADNKWTIRGVAAIKAWYAIKASGASDAVVNITLYGR